MQTLQGITVLDISRLLPGGYASLLLKELGARVIKIEQPGVGDYYRAVSSFKKEPLLAGRQVHALNQGKESLALDLKSPEGKIIFFKLVRKVDVVLENFRPGTLKRLGISYGTIRKIKPSLILCSITGFGQKGKNRSLGGHDLSYLGLSGLLSKIRDHEGRLVIPDFQVIDLATAQEAVARMTSALFQRTRTRRGCWLDISMLKTGYSLARLYPSSVQGGLRESSRYGVYETSDHRWLTFASLEPKFWLKFCDAVHHPEWKNLPLFEGPARKEMEKIFCSRTYDEWIETGRREDLCLFGIDEDLPGFSQKDMSSLGKHTGKILQSLGYTPKQIKIFREKGVVS